MKAQLTLIDREDAEGNKGVEVKLGQKRNGVNDNQSQALQIRGTLQTVLALLNSPFGREFSVTLAAYNELASRQAQLAKQQQEAEQQFEDDQEEEDHESASGVDKPAD